MYAVELATLVQDPVLSVAAPRRPNVASSIGGEQKSLACAVSGSVLQHSVLR